MKLQRTTLILVMLMLGLGGFVYFHEFYWKTQQEEIKNKNQQIFSFQADDVQSLAVKTKSATIILERNNNSDRPKWRMTSPQQVPANDAIVSYLTDLLVKGESERTISSSVNQLGEFGLTAPQATIDIKLKNQQNHQLLLGKSDFNNRFLYAQTDLNPKPDGNVDVLLVSKDFGNAVNRELSEWQETPNQSESTPLPSLNLPISPKKEKTK
ncbi:MAG: DUF4340 domain-containing protein [Pelatocladus maniniholoensis HA4357-MV3]|jgi:hypothetical protein|uniref:DUF4340 domain-containing protein n=1 Tax=Pelatocladus maniniholoensis HA4357-MV3 TaxID=1117104 RepID=A0A9E3H9X2_9NOST|nr:DUF4340 domain-containing protein [Pelatocladus maniniholoensis HA4357-MV3]BAZ68985.1 hypothetical protein NIES4106_37540 [Fischerella sp. NIES-4106]